MKEIKIFEDVYQFNSGSVVIPIRFNQYLILGDEPLLDLPVKYVALGHGPFLRV